LAIERPSATVDDRMSLVCPIDVSSAAALPRAGAPGATKAKKQNQTTARAAD